MGYSLTFVTHALPPCRARFKLVAHMPEAMEMTDHTEQRSPRPGHRWRLAGWSAAALLLLLPLAAMPFTDEVAWGPGDFLLAGALVGGLGLGCELAVRKTSHWAYRAGAVLALAGGFVLVWANAAVGIMGSEEEAVNWLFYMVPGAGVVGACLARFRAHGLSWAMLSTAVAQSLAMGVAAEVGSGFEPVAFVFIGLWIGAAWLFRLAK